MPENPLGKPSDIPQIPDSGLLYAIPRWEARSSIGLDTALPFHGEDLWNAWELSWLDDRGKPLVATACLRIPAESPNIIESKSLKLYLNSLASTRFSSAADFCAAVVADLTPVVGHELSLQLDDNVAEGTIDQLPGRCIDTLDPAGSSSYPDPSVLEVMGDEQLSEDLYSHLLRSNCPVTGQPDSGSILIRYRGRQIDAASLLQYLISYRQHNEFHEACVERIFVDLKQQCAPEQLTVYARYNRRGGIDINPFRSDFEASADNLRLKRQ